MNWGTRKQKLLSHYFTGEHFEVDKTGWKYQDKRKFGVYVCFVVYDMVLQYQLHVSETDRLQQKIEILTQQLIL